MGGSGVGSNKGRWEVGLPVRSPSPAPAVGGMVPALQTPDLLRPPGWVLRRCLSVARTALFTVHPQVLFSWDLGVPFGRLCLPSDMSWGKQTLLCVCFFLCVFSPNFAKVVYFLLQFFIPVWELFFDRGKFPIYPVFFSPETPLFVKFCHFWLLWPTNCK